jgi:hypothetical protein
MEQTYMTIKSVTHFAARISISLAIIGPGKAVQRSFWVQDYCVLLAVLKILVSAAPDHKECQRSHKAVQKFQSAGSGRRTYLSNLLIISKMTHGFLIKLINKYRNNECDSEQPASPAPNHPKKGDRKPVEKSQIEGQGVSSGDLQQLRTAIGRRHPEMTTLSLDC